MQLDIFSLPQQNQSGELPKAIAHTKPKIHCELVEGCRVRSDLFFKGKTAKVISLQQIGAITLATVEIEFRGSLIHFPCGTKSLEVVE